MRYRRAPPLLSVCAVVLAAWLGSFAFLHQLFANRIGGFFGLDVIVSALVLWVFIFSEGARVGIRHLWLPVVTSLIVGVSLGLPLFLYMRQRHLDAITTS